MIDGIRVRAFQLRNDLDELKIERGDDPLAYHAIRTARVIARELTDALNDAFLRTADDEQE